MSSVRGHRVSGGFVVKIWGVNGGQRTLNVTRLHRRSEFLNLQDFKTFFTSYSFEKAKDTVDVLFG